MSSETFDEFYGATAGRTLRYAYAMCGDHGVAQDLTQEAYIRAWQRWSRLADYDHPESWLRLVVTRLVTDRWRWIGVRNRATVHSGQWSETVPPPSDDTIVINDALRRLPVRQRQAIVMHYLMDMPISAIAEETGAAIGTVKSWLSRGRDGLALSLGEGMPTARPTDVRATADRRTRKRATVATVSVIVIVLLVGALVYLRTRKDSLPPVTPTPSPSHVAQALVPPCRPIFFDPRPYYGIEHDNGMIKAKVVLQNVAAAPCVLSGYPVLNAIEAITDSATVLTLNHPNDSPQLTLIPGERAMIVVTAIEGRACANPVTKRYERFVIIMTPHDLVPLRTLVLSWSCEPASISAWQRVDVPLDQVAPQMTREP